MKAFEAYLNAQRGRGLDDADPEDLEAFVTWIERAPKASAKGYLHAIHYYYTYTADEAMAHLAGALRAARIERTPFRLREFRGVDPACVARLEAAGVRDVRQMLAAGRTAGERAALAEKTGVPEAAILELVKLSDLARIPGVKGTRARLYYDAGVDTLDKLAAWEPEALRAMVGAFVERTGFEGIPPLPKGGALHSDPGAPVAEGRRILNTWGKGIAPHHKTMQEKLK
ncbi:MAG: DUF4332 domain-containing protein [Anaerolineae bacterium]|nr:DUF4332 domain-containing protein [Anaerolineae bacterium]